jgi:hypothetical protein
VVESRADTFFLRKWSGDWWMGGAQELLCASGQPHLGQQCPQACEDGAASWSCFMELPLLPL